MTFEGLKREIESGAIVAVSTRLGRQGAREEMVAAAMRRWEQEVIEAALGKEAVAVLPEAIRLMSLRAGAADQKEMLHYLARRNGTSVDRGLAL